MSCGACTWAGTSRTTRTSTTTAASGRSSAASGRWRWPSWASTIWRARSWPRSRRPTRSATGASPSGSTAARCSRWACRARPGTPPRFCWRARPLSAAVRDLCGGPYAPSRARTGALPRRALGAHRRRRLAHAADRALRRAALQGPVFARLAARLRAADLGLRAGALAARRAVGAAGVDASAGGRVDAAGLRADRGGLCAAQCAEGTAGPPDAAEREDLGGRAPDRQRHAGGRAAVRQLPRVGGAVLPLGALARPRVGHGVSRRHGLGHLAARCDRGRRLRAVRLLAARVAVRRATLALTAPRREPAAAPAGARGG